jgi:hypothetical protein
MKQISTGAGLLGLGVCMVATALIATHHGSREAFAYEATVTPTMASAISDCDIRVENWFDPTPHTVRGCKPFGWTQMRCFTTQPVDHLGNGMARPSIYGVDNDEDSSVQFVDVLDLQTDSAGATTISRIRVLTLADWSLGSGFEMDGGGWIDMDSDGDMDLLVHNGMGGWTWFENIAGTGTSANPYDLDHDGSVNTADLSLLLMEFTD